MDAANTPAQAPELMTPQELAHNLAVSEETLTTWRSRKSAGIPFVKVGRLVRYRRADVAAYIESRLCAA